MSLLTYLCHMTGLDHLRQLQLEDNKRKYPNFPDNYRPVTKYKTSTANGLTRAITDFLNYSGHFATRINNQGTWVKDKAHVNKGYYRPSTQVKGIADIQATINGRTVHIEIKIGKDRQSEAQKEFEARVKRSGAEYWIIKDFDQFYEKYSIFANHEANRTV